MILIFISILITYPFYINIIHSLSLDSSLTPFTLNAPITCVNLTGILFLFFFSGILLTFILKVTIFFIYYCPHITFLLYPMNPMTPLLTIKITPIVHPILSLVFLLFLLTNKIHTFFSLLFFFPYLIDI